MRAGECRLAIMRLSSLGVAAGPAEETATALLAKFATGALPMPDPLDILSQRGTRRAQQPSSLKEDLFSRVL